MNTKNQKIMQWTTKDIVANAIVYVVNVIVIGLLFMGAVYINALSNPNFSVEDYVQNLATPLHFLILLILTVAIMAFYLAYEDKDFLKNPANSEMLFLILEFTIICAFLSGTYIHLYIRPTALVPLLTLFLTNRRKAIFMNFIACIVVFLFDSFSGTSYEIGNYPVLIMTFSSGIIASLSMDTVHSRLKLLGRSFLIALPSIVCVAMSLIEHSINYDFWGIFVSLASGLASGPLAVSLLMILLPVYEALFKKVSKFKFSELIEHKSKLIKKMISQAPGTFNHAIVVSNIAEACATAIDEDALLARTCAYYHDIGKLRRPEFFKENQADGINPHDDLTPELSANIIKSHTQDGYDLIMKSRLPKELADVCLQHHGTLPILYFYGKAKKYTDGDVDLAQYCYAGPKPQTKIAAIVMIADGCEAAARSLQDRSRENVKKVVRQIVNERMQLGQFEECEITLKELNIIIHTVVNHLTGVYHSRIEYPKVSLDGMEM